MARKHVKMQQGALEKPDTPTDADEPASKRGCISGIFDIFRRQRERAVFDPICRSKHQRCIGASNEASSVNSVSSPTLACPIIRDAKSCRSAHTLELVERTHLIVRLHVHAQFHDPKMPIIHTEAWLQTSTAFCSHER